MSWDGAYRVYVIEAWLPTGKRVMYVGQSAYSPHQRLHEQVNGKRYCSHCRKRHYAPGPRGTRLRLRKDLAGWIGRYRFRDRIEAERAERWLAQELKSMGYIVKGGH